MSSQAIKQALEGFVDVLRNKPKTGRAPRTATVRVSQGTLCEIDVDGHKLLSDTPNVLGGQNKGPTPGALLRASLGSCLAISYVGWAARLGIPVEHVEVVIEGDFDPRGALGAAEVVPVEYGAFRYKALIKSPASRERVQEVFETANKHSTVLQTISRAIPVNGEWQAAS
jgi:uncharacterized OsmC-like protein